MNFAAMGYSEPADWARLRDLVPDDLDAGQRKRFRELQGSGQSKDGFLRMLREWGIDVPTNYVTGSRTDGKETASTKDKGDES